MQTHTVSTWIKQTIFATGFLPKPRNLGGEIEHAVGLQHHVKMRAILASTPALLSNTFHSNILSDFTHPNRSV